MEHISSSAFINEKIRQLGTAVMHCHSNQVLSLKSTIIETLHVDEMGQIWFHVDKPMQKISEFDREFLVGLNYFKKGCPYYLNALGVARIIIEPEEINGSLLDQHIDLKPKRDNKVLVKVKITNVNYYGQEAEAKASLFDKIKTAFMHLLIPGESAHYNHIYAE